MYGIRKLSEYEGFLDMSWGIPRILMAAQTPAARPGKDLPPEYRPGANEIAEAKSLMDRIDELLKSGAELDPEILAHVRTEYARLTGAAPEPVALPVAAAASDPGKKRTGLELFLPRPPADAGPANEEDERVPVVLYEQREEDKRTPEENYMLKFVFGLLDEARAKSNKYIDNDAFLSMIAPRREFEEDGVMKVETYSTRDIIQLFIAGLDKLTEESKQTLTSDNWDDETAGLFRSVVGFASDRKIGVDKVKYVLRRQLGAIGHTLDMDSRRIRDKLNE